MYRGTTPTLTFTLPMDASELSTYYITISQVFGKSVSPIIEKSDEDCESAGRVITCVLSQEDTLLLSDGQPVLIQIRALTTEDVALASKIFRTTADMILKEGVIE